jgi:serine/threonine protein kinase
MIKQSPENFSEKKFNKSTDIWSLGILFYEIAAKGYIFCFQLLLNLFSENYLLKLV